MPQFREKTPKRRDNREPCTHYKSYKDTLRDDFNKRCGYCDDSDFFKVRSFAIDHFVPRNPEDFEHDIDPNYYYNLVYACSFCNLAKSNKWPTKDATRHNDGEVGFIEPTNDDYSNFFKRAEKGDIQSNGVNNLLAQHIIKELKLWLAVHTITWRLEKLYFLEKEISLKLQTNSDPDAKAEHYEIMKEISKLYENLFKVNE
jgi:5-methylcytosine-specific restriction endonuclease McrA